MRIVFWGTPSFALPSLRALVGEGHDVCAVVTQPDRRAGRGRELRAPEVKRLAIEEGIPVRQPERARGDEFEDWLHGLEADLSVVVAYGQILPAAVLEIPSSGSVNLHASLLPALRGAAPIPWAIAQGAPRTGVTVMRMVEAMDAGPILLQVVEPIGEDETAAELTARLSEIGAEALVEALALLEAGDLEARPQDESLATHQGLVDDAAAAVRLGSGLHEVSRLVRGCDPQPGAYVRLRGERVRLYDASVREGEGESGTIVSLDEQGIGIALGGGILQCGRVRADAGKERAEAWATRAGVAVGDAVTDG